MDIQQIADLYYDAWRLHAGDMSRVPLADDFTFSGPVASFDNPDGYRAMARKAGAATRNFHVRHQFIDADLACSIIDWEMTMVPAPLSSAELLRIRDGEIVSGELIYDGEALRRALADASGR